MKRKLIFPGLHISCVASFMGNVSVNSSAQNVANLTLLNNVSSYIQNSALQIGEPQINIGEEEIEKERIGIEGIKEVRPEALREEEIGVVNLQSMIGRINHLNHQEKE